ncbi:probable RNA 3'-terminal phosphate cyclase-like protein [Prunus dulcis]|uniref:probable RNA 3'-terminal phosphate cyclase-like protein n=1 Tax=Prunus dulcis TaxID=3755 RepID=UPI0014829DA0|nr:probable RNA 3'-terminal phosphate cyclase-like protein [Prunus dulcis]
MLSEFVGTNIHLKRKLRIKIYQSPNCSASNFVSRQQHKRGVQRAQSRERRRSKIEKTRYKKLFGSQNLRQQLVLSTLTFTPIQIHDIRNNETWPGLRMYEVALLKLLALVCHGCSFEINDTGNGFKFKPGIVMGGSKLEHDCDVERSIWYFLEPLILLGLFARKPITITLKDGILTIGSGFRYMPLAESFSPSFQMFAYLLTIELAHKLECHMVMERH